MAMVAVMAWLRGERPDLSMRLGSALMVGSGLFTLARSHR